MRRTSRIVAAGCLALLAAGAAGTQQPTPAAAPTDTAARSALAGEYRLVAIDGNALPFAPEHAGRPADAPRLEVLDAHLLVRPDGSFIQAMGYRMTPRAGGEPHIFVRAFSGRCTTDGDAYLARWDGAGTTRVTLARDTLVVDNHGTAFAFRKLR